MNTSFSKLIINFCKYFCLILLCNMNTVNVYEYKNLSSFREQILKETRKPKLLSFESTDDDQIGIHVEFSVPFIKIPVKKAISNFQQGLPVANINLGAAVLSGAIGFGVLVVLPGLIGLFQKPTVDFGYRDISAISENSKWSTMFNNLEEYFLLQNMDPSSCFQKALCWLVQNSAVNVARGKGQSTDKIIDGLASNTITQYFIEGTIFDYAIQDGYTNKNCSNIYSSCNINEKILINIMKNLSTVMKTGI